MTRNSPRFSRFRDLETVNVDWQVHTTWSDGRADGWDPVSYRRPYDPRGKSVATNGSYFPAYRASELTEISCVS